MTRLGLVGLFAALLVIGLLGTPSRTHGQQLSDTVDVPSGAVALGTVNLPRSVMANGQTLSAGEYEVHLTDEQAAGETVGALAILERWVEFRQGDNVRGREVVTIVPRDEITDVAKTTGPGAGSSRVELLKESDYMRVWINQAGTHYLIHLVVS